MMNLYTLVRSILLSLFCCSLVITSAVVQAQTITACATHTGLGNENLPLDSSMYLCNANDTLKITLNGSALNTGSYITLSLPQGYFNIIQTTAVGSAWSVNNNDYTLPEYNGAIQGSIFLILSSCALLNDVNVNSVSINITTNNGITLQNCNNSTLNVPININFKKPAFVFKKFSTSDILNSQDDKKYVKFDTINRYYAVKIINGAISRFKMKIKAEEEIHILSLRLVDDALVPLTGNLLSATIPSTNTDSILIHSALMHSLFGKPSLAKGDSLFFCERIVMRMYCTVPLPASAKTIYSIVNQCPGVDSIYANCSIALTANLNVLQANISGTVLLTHIGLSDTLNVCGTNSSKYSLAIVPVFNMAQDSIDSLSATTRFVDFTLPINLIYFAFDSITQDHNPNAINYTLALNPDSLHATITITSSDLGAPYKQNAVDTFFTPNYHTDKWQFLHPGDTLFFHIHGLRFRCPWLLKTCNTQEQKFNLTTTLSNSYKLYRLQRPCQLETADIVTVSSLNIANKWLAKNDAGAQVFSYSNTTDVGPGTPAGNTAHFTFTQVGGADSWKLKDALNNTILDCPKAHHYAVFHKPSNYLLGDVYIQYGAQQQVLLDTSAIVAMNDSTYSLNYYQIPGYDTSGVIIDIDVTLTCPPYLPPHGANNFILEFRSFCDTACTACYRTLGCGMLTLYRHCPGSCESAVSIESVIINRKTLGWSNYAAWFNSPNQSDLTPANLNGTELSKVYPCDTVSVQAQGYVFTLPDNSLLQFEILYQPPGTISNTILQFVSGTFELTDTANTVVASYNATITDAISFINPDTTDFPGSVLLRVSIPESSLVYLLLQDSAAQYHLTFYGLYALSGPGIQNLPVGVYEFPQIRAQFVAGYLDTVLTAAHSCDPYGDNLTLIQIKTDVIADVVASGPAPNTGFNIFPTLSECNIRYILQAKTYGGTNGDDFPMEYRPVFFLGDTSHFHFVNPVNFSFELLRQSLTTLFNSPQWVTVPVSIVQDANGFGLNHILQPTDKYAAMVYNSVEFRIIQQCSNTLNTVFLDTFKVSNTCDLYNLNATYTKPVNLNASLTLMPSNGLYSIPVSSNTVQIPMTYYHNDVGNNIRNAWIYFESASQTSANLNAVNNLIYVIDTLRNMADATHFNLSVTLNCLNDTLPYSPLPVVMHYGYNCSTAPGAAFTLDSLLYMYSCVAYTDTIWLQPQSPNLDLEIQADTLHTDSCIYIYYTAQFSAQNLTNTAAQNVWLYLTPVAGFSYVPQASYVTFNNTGDLQYYYNGAQAPGPPAGLINVPGFGLAAIWSVDSVLLDDVFSTDSIQSILYHFAFIPSCYTDAGIFPVQGLISAVNACNDTVYSQIASGSWTFTSLDSSCCNNVFKFETEVKPACDSMCNGSVTFSWSGGHPPYYISVNNQPYIYYGYGMHYTLDSLCAGGTVCIALMDSLLSGITDCVVIPVSSPEVYITLPQYKPCKGDMILLEGGETVHYIWQSNSDTLGTTQSISVSPMTPTWYTLTGIDSFGCVNYDTALVNIDTFTVYVNISDTNFCNNDSGYIQLVASTNLIDAVTYAWEPSAGLSATTGATVYASPSVTTTYTLIGFHDECVDKQFVVVHVDCCVPIRPKRVHTSGEFASLNQWLSSGTLANAQLDIQGTLTVDTDLTLYKDTLSIFTGKQITVQSGYTLTINNCILYACKDMWSGIRLEPGAHLIMNNTLILDADTALLSRSNPGSADAYGYYHLNYVTFNKNRYGVVQQPHPNLSNTHLSIRGCKFTCVSNALWSPGNTLKAPYSNQRSHTAIVMDMSLDEPSLTLGASNSIIERNEITAHRYGIRSFGGRFTVVNSLIHHLYNITSCGAIDGTAVWQQGGSLYMSSVNSYYNTIDQCKAGVVYEGGNPGNVLSIEGNQFSNIGNGLYCALGQTKANGAVWVRQSSGMNLNINSNTIVYSDRAIRVIGCHYSNITAKYNSIDGCALGIVMRENDQAEILVYENDINQNILPQNYGIEGINISQVIGNPATATVSGNRISKIRTGIVGNNCEGILIEYNEITFMPNINSATAKYGIRINNCSGAQIIGNLIVKQGNAAQNGQQNQLFGINVELSSPIRIHSNTIARCGTAIRIMGDNNGGLNAEAQLKCNRMVDYYYGIRLDAAGIGAQGDEEHPGDNRWEIGTSLPGMLDLINILNSENEWWVRDLSGRPWRAEIVSGISPTYLISDTSQPTTCNFDTEIPDRRAEYALMIKNQGRYRLDSINAANDYQNKWMVYDYLLHDSSYFNYGDTLDAHFTAFADTFKTTVAGVIGNISQYLRTGDTLQAQAYLSTLIPNDSAEYVYAQVLRIYERSWARGNYELDSILYAEAHKFAIRQPHSSGAAVFMARVMTEESFDDFLTQPQGSRKEESTSDSTVARYLLYPNPNNGLLYYAWADAPQGSKQLSISDMQGKQVLQQSITGSEGIILLNLAELSNGVYILHLLGNGTLYDTQKLIKQ